MNATVFGFGPNRDPVAALAGGDGDAVLAIITRTEGPSYRPVGAVMAIASDGERTGTLSSGCIENDLAVHAGEALADGKPRTVLYGRGSPFMDIRLPCGGGLEILLVPRPDRLSLARVSELTAARTPCTLVIGRRSGALSVHAGGDPHDADPADFVVHFVPDIRFLVFGKGPEAATFAGLVAGAGYPALLLSPDEETLDLGRKGGCETRHVVRPHLPGDVGVDPWTAIVLFFHDHDWEPPILADAVKTKAFYIGAQGSRRARDARMLELEAMGVTAGERARLKGPVGLVPSARDARTLAVSVLAEVLAEAGKGR